MISHCVFIRYRKDATDAMRDDIYKGLQALKPRIPGLTQIIIGANSSPEGLDKGFSEGFIVTFRNAEARDQYLADEEHGKVGAKIVAAAEGGIEGILVYDLSY